MSYVPASRRAWSVADPYLGPRPGPNDRIISVTNLLQAPRISRLMALYRDQIPPDEPGTDSWKLLGTAVHAALEKAAAHADPPPILVEHRAVTEVSVDGVAWTLSGQCDVLEADGTLWDYKTTSAYSVRDGREGKSDWASQLNVLRWLLERTGAVPRGAVRSLGVWAILRDWSATQAQRDAGYPQGQEVAVPIPLWTEEETHAYVLDRLRLHEAARHSLPECSPEERWAKDAGFAVLKSSKSVRAERILPTRQDAERYRDELLGGKGLIEERYGTSIRCLRYCPAKSVCTFAQSLVDSR
jgi:hypothetical protein